MIRNHHEAWDGSGYPDGLAGENIPLLARLLQAADAYDAMIAERPYQVALSEQEVLSHFRQYAGVLYDPLAAKALCAVVGGADRRRPDIGPAGKVGQADEEVDWQAVPERGSSIGSRQTTSSVGELADIASHEGTG